MSTVDDIRRGESEVLEFKQELPKKDRQLLKTVVAFANSQSGGRIIFGVDDYKNICGIEVDSIAALKDNLINMIAEACTPQIYVSLSVETVENKTIVVAEIPNGRHTPYFIKKEGMNVGTYVRIGATTRNAEREQLEELILEGNNKSYDSVVERDAGPVNNSDIAGLAKLIHSYLGDDAKPVSMEQMVGWKLLSRRANVLMPTVAFRLLTYNDIYFARIQCGAFVGNTTDEFLDKKEFDGSVCKQLEDAQAFILRHINTGARINGLYRDNVYEIPISAIREALSNALLHRNYLTHAHIRVAVFPDRVEIFSPGALYCITEQQMLNGCSSLRNPILADVFHKMNIVEKWGSGIGRMYKTCAEAQVAPPQFKVDSAGVLVTFPRGIVDTVAPKPQQDLSHTSLSDNQRAVLKYIKAHPSATYAKVGLALSISKDAVKYALAQLKSKGMVLREGSDKKGRWIVL